MIAYSPLSKSYKFDRGYCHNKVNESKNLIDFSRLKKPSQPNFSTGVEA